MFINLAYAQDAAAAAPSGPLGALGSFLPIILIFGVFYFLLIRPQQKQQKLIRKMIADVKRGDEVITGSGIHGKVTEVQDSVILLQAAQNVTLKVERSAIQKVKGYTPS